MLDLITRLFGNNKNTEPEDQKEMRFRNIHIATCALLLEMSTIDGEFSEAEKESIIQFFRKEYELTDEYATALIEISNKKLEKSTDLWRFASLINERYSIEEKIRIIEIIWTVAYADGKLDKHEDYLIHKLANLLRLTHKQLIDAKLKAKAQQSLNET